MKAIVMTGESRPVAMAPTGVLAAILSALGLSTLAIFAKLGLALGMTPLELIQYRFGIGALVLFFWLGWRNPGQLRLRPKGIVRAALLGLGVYPVQSYCFIKSLAYIPAATTSLIFYIYPLTTTLLAMLFFGLRPTRIIWAAMGIICMGCVLVFHDAFSHALDMRGILYALTCMLFFSGYLTLIQIFTREDDPRRLGPWVILFMALVFTCISPPVSLFSHGVRGILVALGLGLLPTALAVTLLYRAVGEMGSAYTAIFSSIEPAATVFLAILVLGEDAAPARLVGMLCIIAGIILPNAHLVVGYGRLRMALRKERRAARAGERKE